MTCLLFFMGLLGLHAAAQQQCCNFALFLKPLANTVFQDADIITCFNAYKLFQVSYTTKCKCAYSTVVISTRVLKKSTMGVNFHVKFFLKRLTPTLHWNIRNRFQHFFLPVSIHAFVTVVPFHYTLFENHPKVSHFTTIHSGQNNT